MEKLIIPLVLILAIALCGSAYAPEIDVGTDSMIEHLTFEHSRDFMADMICAAATGDHEAGEAAETARNAKIDALGTGHVKVAYWDLVLVARIINAEAGSDWLSDEHRLYVGNVLLNRVASPEFPDTIEDCIYQPGQYYSRTNQFFANLLPPERDVKLALRLLEGERLMPTSVVFQSNFYQGSGVWREIKDKYLGSTYFCLSSNLELYGEG